MERREFFRWLGVAAVAANFPGFVACGGKKGSSSDGGADKSGRFLDARQWATAAAVAALFFPADDTPGAEEAGAVEYIDGLLSVFDDDPPHVFCGGPFSGRTPFPAADGSASTNFPSDNFLEPVPLTRVQQIAWRMRILGSAAVPGGDFNDAVLGPVRGLRDVYTEGLAALEADAQQRFGAHFADLETANATQVFQAAANMHADFVRDVTEHVIEGIFAAPEYGGNTDLVGWQLARFEGDSMPRGYSFYDPSSDKSVDVPEHPTSVATPGDAPEDFSSDVISVLEIAALGSGGMRFF